MKTKIFILCSLLFVLSHPLTYCQSKSKEKSKSDKVSVESIDSMKIVIDSLRIKFSDMDRMALNDKQTIDSLKNLLSNDNRSIDYLRDSLAKEISARDMEILKLRSNIGFVDTCMVKLANRWLYEKFDKQSVDDAISYFDRIYNKQLKSDLSVVQRLLRSYESAYSDFQSILKQAQNDIERKSPFAVDEFKDKYLRKIQSMPYYIQYYASDWNIRYLNEKIKETLDILQRHSAETPADFSLLID